MSVGFILLLDEPQRSDDLRSLIEDNRPFSDALSLPDFKIHNKAVALLSLGSGCIDFAALAVCGRRIATKKFHVTFSEYLDLRALPIEEIEKEFQPGLSAHFVRAFSGHGRTLPPETLNQVLAAIKRLRPSIAGQVDYLLRIASSSPEKWSSNSAAVLAEERDALQLARRVFGEDTLQEPLRWRGSPSAGLPSFLEGLEQSVVVREDTLVNHDANVFGAWNLARRHQVGSVEFERHGNRLTVMTANRTPLEETLGVDLIYYNHQYDSFVLVQYKRLQREYGRLTYRPRGESYRRELATMRRLRQALPAPCEPPLFKEFRLCWQPFFFKLCAVEGFDPNRQDLIQGMYFPLDFWETLLESDSITGPRGGKFLNYDNAGRWINNTLFVSLLQDGWIGSATRCSEALKDVVQETLRTGRSLMFAATSEGRR